MNMPSQLPPIVIGAQDYNRLVSTAALHRARTMPNRNFLISELRRASICHPGDLPEKVVSVRSRVTYRLGKKGRSVVQDLVYPEDLTRPESEISVTTALGIALIGLRIGARMPFRTCANEPLREVLVEDVCPEAKRPGPVRSLRNDENSNRDLDRRLDEALTETFPASDPISVMIDRSSRHVG